MAYKATEARPGRTFIVRLNDGDDLFSEIQSLCTAEKIAQAYIPCFVGAFREVRLVGTCRRADADRPMLDSEVELEHVEVVGAGTLAHHPTTGEILPHVHISVGQRLHSAVGSTSHLFGGTVEFILELVLVEIESPGLTRIPDPAIFDIPALTF